MSKYKKMFVDEAREHLALAGQHLVALEKSPGDKALINELFRNAHSIKGMAASLGYEEISNLSHVLEDLLDLYRSENRILDSSAIDLLLQTIDFIEEMINEVDENAPLSDPTDLICKIQQLISGDSAPDPSGPPVTTAGPVGTEDSSGDHEKVTQPESSPQTEPRGACLRVVFRVDRDSVSPGARGFLAVRKLGTLGTLARLRPGIGAIKSGQYGRVIETDLDTKLQPDEVAQALEGIPEIIDVRIEAASAGSIGVGSKTGPSAPPEAPLRAKPATVSSTVRVKTEALDRFVDAVGELILNKSELREIARDLDSEALQQGLSRLEGSLEELKRQALGVRLTPLERVLGALPRLVRDLARSREKQVRLEIRGADLELDRAIVDALNEPLIHLVRNALDHGFEGAEERSRTGKESEGRLLIEAYREKDIAVIHVEDDGRGVDVKKVREMAIVRTLISAEEAQSADEESILNLLFMPGMSTASEVSDISGRGVGLDAVKVAVQGLGGSVSIQSRAGGGTQFTLRIPFSATILRALIVRVGEEIYAVPIAKLHRALEVGEDDIMRGSSGSSAQGFCRVHKELLPARSLSDLLGFGEGDDRSAHRAGSRPVIVADTRAGRTALLVDDLVGEEEVFVKPLGRPLASLESLSGLTVLGNGRPVFVLDPYGLGAALPAGEREGSEAGEESDA